MNMHVGKTSILSTLDFIEDGRADIYKWGETRLSKRKGIRGKLYQFKKLFIDKSILKSFAHNLTVIVLLQMILAALATFLCQRLELDFDVHVSIFVSPIVFPLAFSINADFQRRERVLEDLAQLKGALVILFFCHRDWLQSSGLGKDFLKTLNQKLKGLVLNIKEYLLTEKVMRRSFILSVIYEDFSDISQLNDKMRTSTLPHNSPLITRLVHYHNLLCHAFERLRVIREYRSPRTIRSFTKVFIFLMPIVLSPYYVHMGIKSGNVWSPYYIAVLSSFMFGTLQGVQDVLDDPFDGISEDDINLGQLEDWTAQSLITNRTITVGRFTVTTSVKGKKEGDMDDTGSDSDGPPSPPRVVHRRKPILRKGSRARVEHGETHPDRARRGMALYPETASRLEDMQRHGLTGSTTILPGMKMKRANSDSLTMSGSNASLAMQFLRAQEMANGGREPELKKQVSFCRHVRGLSDDDQEDSDRDEVFDGPASEPTRYPRLSWMIGETDPLIDPDSKASSDVDTETGTSTLSTPELLPRDLPVPQELYEGLRHSPGTSRVVRRPVPAKKNSDAPGSLAKLFMPDRTPDHSDDPVSPPINHAVSLPTSLQTLFAPPPKNLQEFPSHSGVSSRSPSPTRPHVLPISPLALPESPGPSRPKKRSFPAERISRSVPSSPERKHWDNLFRSSAPMMTPSPENAVRIPLTPISTPGISGCPVNLIDQTDAPEPTSGNSRFAVLSPVPTSPVRTTSPQAAHAPLAPEECQVIDTGVVSKPIDMPGSRFRISSSRDADASQGEGQPLVASPVKNYGVTDPSPDISPSSPPPDVQPSRPSRFSVNPPRKTSQPSEQTGFDESLSRGTPDPGSTRRPSLADHILNIDYDSSEVYI